MTTVYPQMEHPQFEHPQLKQPSVGTSHRNKARNNLGDGQDFGTGQDGSRNNSEFNLGRDRLRWDKRSTYQAETAGQQLTSGCYNLVNTWETNMTGADRLG
jgi:hypothetical protein